MTDVCSLRVICLVLLHCNTYCEVGEVEARIRGIAPLDAALSSVCVTGSLLARGDSSASLPFGFWLARVLVISS